MQKNEMKTVFLEFTRCKRCSIKRKKTHIYLFIVFLLSIYVYRQLLKLYKMHNTSSKEIKLKRGQNKIIWYETWLFMSWLRCSLLETCRSTFISVKPNLQFITYKSYRDYSDTTFLNDMMIIIIIYFKKPVH